MGCKEKERLHRLKGAIKKIKGFIQEICRRVCKKVPFNHRKHNINQNQKWEETRKENPYLPRLRKILEQVLESYGMDYRKFCPLLIDTDTLPESMLDVDDVELVLEQISQDLNFLKIATERPAYFASYIERMYEDAGLVVQIEEKGQVSLEGINVVLDMEQKGSCNSKYIKEHVLYIPVYKKPWNGVEGLQNLDISIPIGYNTVIVKGR